jgi:hypothetical protein
MMPFIVPRRKWSRGRDESRAATDRFSPRCALT